MSGSSPTSQPLQASPPHTKRGRKRNDNLPPNRARDVQRAFRARRAAHLEALEMRVQELEDENAQFRVALKLPPADRPPLGKGPTGKDRPKQLPSLLSNATTAVLAPPSQSPNCAVDSDMDRSTGSPASARTASLSPSIGAPTGEHWVQRQQHMVSSQRVLPSHDHGEYSSPTTAPRLARPMSTQVPREPQSQQQRMYISSDAPHVDLNSSHSFLSLWQHSQEGYYNHYVTSDQPPPQCCPDLPQHRQPYSVSQQPQQKDAQHSLPPVSPMAPFHQLSQPPPRGPYDE